MTDTETDPRDEARERAAEASEHDQIMRQLKQMNITLVALTSCVLDMASRINADQEEEQDTGPDLRTL